MTEEIHVFAEMDSFFLSSSSAAMFSPKKIPDQRLGRSGEVRHCSRGGRFGSCGLPGASDVRELAGKVGAQFLAPDAPASFALNIRAALGRHLAGSGFPLTKQGVRDTETTSQRGAGFNRGEVNV